jgi:hypothetical protein
VPHYTLKRNLEMQVCVVGSPGPCTFLFTVAECKARCSVCELMYKFRGKNWFAARTVGLVTSHRVGACHET